MKGFLLFIAFALCILCLTIAAPAENRQSVQFLKYSNDKEFEELQRQIIAQYENLGGSTKFHQEQSISYVDPSNLKITLN